MKTIKQWASVLMSKGRKHSNVYLPIPYSFPKPVPVFTQHTAFSLQIFKFLEICNEQTEQVTALESIVIVESFFTCDLNSL
ncbi:hypothetical protein FKM82_012027 [Ascaphus truei]